MLKLLIKNNLLSFFSHMGGKKGKNRKPKKALGFTGAVLLGLCLFLVFFLAFGAMAFGFAEVSKTVDNSTWLLGTLGAVMGFLLIFMGSVYYTTSAVFDSKDNELLLSMPIPPGSIVLSRLLTLLLLDEFYGLTVMVPFGLAGLISGLFTPFGTVLYLLSALLLPFFALAVTCLLSYLFSAIMVRMKHPKVFETVLMFVSFALYLVFYISMQNLVPLFTKYADPMVRVLSRLYPLCFMGEAAEGRVLSFALILGICLLSVLFAWLLLRRSFIRLVTTRVTGRKHRYRPSREGMKTRSPLSALTRREIRRFFGIPMYLFNAGTGLLMTLGGAILLFLKGGSLVDALTGEGLPAGLLFPFLALGFLLLAAMTGISAPSVAIEGKSLWILRASPLSAKDILRSKALAHLLVATPVNLLSCLLLGLGFESFSFGLLLFLSLTGFTAFVAYLGVVMGCALPRFDFPSEAAAVKQSGAVAMTLLLSFLSALILPVPGLLVGLFVDPLPGMVLLCLTCFGAAALLRLVMTTRSARQFDGFSS